MVNQKTKTTLIEVLDVVKYVDAIELVSASVTSLNGLVSVTCAQYPHIHRMVTLLLKVIAASQDGGL